MEHILTTIKQEETTISQNETNTTNNATTTTTNKKTQNVSKSSKSKYGDYIDDKWVDMSESEYAERYPVLYHEQAISEGRYDKYHPDMYESDY